MLYNKEYLESDDLGNANNLRETFEIFVQLQFIISQNQEMKSLDIVSRDF